MKMLFFALGSGFSLLSVLFGAFGAHALKKKLTPEMLDIFEVAVRYQMYHSIGLIVVAWAISQWQNSLTNAAGWCFVAGILIFSGSLYILSLTGVRWLGAITPIGGLVFIAGWGCLMIAAFRQ
ncbi:MAG: DUF423 domain-containing protein [Candidatus Poribacteria bacterium]|nr:DUF423 domain-containing protein [Candidatus Poribacteria bacterium]